MPSAALNLNSTAGNIAMNRIKAQPLKPRTGVFLTAPWPLLCVLLQQVVVLQSNGVDQPKESVHVLNVGRLRMRLTKGKSVVAKEFYSSSMQVWLQCMINIVSSLLLLDSGDCEGLYSILVHLLRQEKLACLSLTSEKILPATKDLAVVVTVMWCERRRRSSLAGDVLATQK